MDKENLLTTGHTLLATVRELLDDVWSLRANFEDQITEEVEPTDLGKRQTLFEKNVAEILKYCKPKVPVEIIVEGNKPISPSGEEPEFRWYIDPMDGTNNTCRWQDVNARQVPSDFAFVVSVLPVKDNPTFGDVLIGAGLDLRTGQRWIAKTGGVAFTIGIFTDMADGKKDSILEKLEPNPQYHNHSPLLACEFYRHINWATRLLVNQAVEWSDMASSFINILRVPLGEVDCFFNNVIPDLSEEGQRGHELAAVMPFIKELGAYAIDTRTGESLEHTPFTFDGMTPVIIGVDKATVEYYWTMIQGNLATPGIRDHIGTIHTAMGTQRWSLRELP